MKSKHITTSALALAILLSIPALIPTGSASSSQDDMALIIVSTLFQDDVEENKTISYHDHLTDQGYSADRIEFLAFNDTQLADRISTIDNIESAFGNIINDSNMNKQVAIYIADHEQGIRHNSSFTFIDGNITANQIDIWLDGMRSSDLTVIMTGNRSGLAGYEIQDDDRSVISSMMRNQTVIPDHFNITRSLEDSSADTNQDGRVSYIEAYWKEVENLQEYDQDPCIWI